MSNPTLRFLHKWMGVTLFPREDIRIVREIDMRLLYAMVHKIKVSPVKAMVQHWISAPSRLGSCGFTSIIIKFCQNAMILDDFDQYITAARIVLTMEHFIQARIIAGGPNGTVEFKFRNTETRLTLPCPELKLYGGHPLIPNIPRVGGRASFSGPFTRGKARAKQQVNSDDDSDYAGTSNVMHTSRSGGSHRSGAHSARFSLSSSQETGTRSDRHDMELLNAQFSTLRTGHETIHNTAVET